MMYTRATAKIMRRRRFRILIEIGFHSKIVIDSYRRRNKYMTLFAATADTDQARLYNINIMLYDIKLKLCRVEDDHPHTMSILLITAT